MIPDSVVQHAFYAGLADCFIMREPVTDEFIAGTPGTEKYRSASPGEPSIVSILLDQVVESCKFLLTPREKRPELEVAAKVYGMSRESAFILISVSILTLIVALAMIIGWAHVRAKRKERMKY